VVAAQAEAGKKTNEVPMATVVLDQIDLEGKIALRLAGRPDITEATRWAGRSMDRPFTILGLTS
jgi:hypothetical protein